MLNGRVSITLDTLTPNLDDLKFTMQLGNPVQIDLALCFLLASCTLRSQSFHLLIKEQSLYKLVGCQKIKYRKSSNVYCHSVRNSKSENVTTLKCTHVCKSKKQLKIEIKMFVFFQHCLTNS